MRRRTLAARRVRLRKAAQRARQHEAGMEPVNFEVPAGVMAKLRAVVPLHRDGTLKAVLVDALAAYHYPGLEPHSGAVSTSGASHVLQPNLPSEAAPDCPQSGHKPPTPAIGLAISGASVRSARVRKAEQRTRLRQAGLEQVSFDAPCEVMDKLRSFVDDHPTGTLKGVLADALTEFASHTSKSTQALAALASEYWPKIRPLMPYLTRLASPSAPPIRVQGRVYTHADIAPLGRVMMKMSEMVRAQGHINVIRYLDALVGGTR